MTQPEIKKFIAEKLNAGESLSSVQDQLSALGVKMKFMELRMLADEVEIVRKPAPVKKPEQPAEQPAEPEDAELPPEPEETAPADGKLRGKTTISIDPIQRPGCAACGSVTFGSGAKAEWIIDQTGRLALDKLTGGKPDQQDVREFQTELQKAFSGM